MNRDLEINYEYGDVPEADAPVETPIKTPCVGGPWHGATITHLPGDTASRHVDIADKPGLYVYASSLEHFYWSPYE